MRIDKLKEMQSVLLLRNELNFSMLYIHDSENLQKRCIIGLIETIEPKEILDRFRTKSGVINYEKLGEWYFGIQEGSNEWEYLFSSKWSNDKRTNTAYNGFKRIQKIINGYHPDHIDTEIALESLKRYE